MSDDSQRPIIVKRIKKSAHGHHGGAWKIAYADFVTAMMAFFLLMWLLGSTTTGDLEGIADYFKTPLKVALAGGSGSGDASSVIKGGGQDLTRRAGQVKRGEVVVKRRLINLEAAQAERGEKAMLEELKEKLEGAIANRPELQQLKKQMQIDITGEGLRIQIVDEQQRPMFDSGSAKLKPYMKEIFQEIGKVLNDVPNRISLAGHTDAIAYSGGERGYSNWELSTDRSNAARRELVAGGMKEDRIIRVVGLSSAVPINAEDPLGAQNRRISIVIMNKKTELAITSEGKDAESENKNVDIDEVTDATDTQTN